MAGAGLSAAKPDPDARVADRADALPVDQSLAQDAHAELALLLTDLERVEHLIGELGDDPELTAARANLRARVDAIRIRLK